MNTLKSIAIAVVLSGAFLSVPQVSFAETAYNIKEMTPEVKSALDGRRERFDQLRALKDQGAIGENNKGYVEVLGGDGQAQALANAENKDRRFIYQTIVAQNNLPFDALSTIETVFAQEQRERAKAGDKIQDAGGNWVTK